MSGEVGRQERGKKMPQSSALGCCYTAQNIDLRVESIDVVIRNKPEVAFNAILSMFLIFSHICAPVPH